MKFILLISVLMSTSAFSSICVDQVDESGADWIHCPRSAVTIFKGKTSQREVLWQLPSGKTPTTGWPVVLLSQGSWFPVEFSRPANLPFGGFNEIKLIRELLDQGFAVVAPRATMRVGWITNMPHREYVKTADYQVLAEVLRMIRNQEFGHLNAEEVFATGISSGGYNTSRIGITFQGKLKALAIQSGAYASCLGPLCKLPDTISKEHPPTLFLHGEKDLAVPLWSAMNYYKRLKSVGVETEIVIDPDAGHGWLDVAPAEITKWFKTHLNERIY